MNPGSFCARAVLFDLDGTLLDTAPDMAQSLNDLLAEQSHEPLPFANIRPYVSHGSAALVRLGFPHASEADFLLLRDRFLAIYRRQLAVGTRLFPGVEELLAQLEGDGIPWGIVTNKPAWLTEPLLELLDLRKRTRAVVSGDTFPERKPHPRPLLWAAQQLEVEPAACVYVGDAERDILAARAANMRALVARFGYIAPADKPDEWPAHGWIDAPLEVLDWLEDRSARAAAL
jgi:N-acetyl-D-muramate 6-phosphate phosphatase